MLVGGVGRCRGFGEMIIWNKKACGKENLWLSFFYLKALQSVFSFSLPVWNCYASDGKKFRCWITAASSQPILVQHKHSQWWRERESKVRQYVVNSLYKYCRNEARFTAHTQPDDRWVSRSAVVSFSMDLDFTRNLLFRRFAACKIG